MADRTFRAMGGWVTLSVDDAAGPVLDELVRVTCDLEARWSRFLPDSEVSQLNEAPGLPALVSHDTAALLDVSRRAHIATGGWFDPLMLREIVASGYRHSFELIGRFGGQMPGLARGLHRGEGRPSIRDLDVDLEIGLVHMPADAAFDPGGIGRGFAADCVVERGLQQGAEWVIADLGGDIRIGGRERPFGEVRLDIGHPAGGTLCAVSAPSGAVARSRMLSRTWRGADGGVRHHLIDPTTGAPTESDLATVTVLASKGWWAEAAATAAVVAGRSEGLAMLRDVGLSALAVDCEGEAHMVGNIEAFLL